MDYEVSDTDTIERIAALHDCTVGELVKMNKLGRRMLFPGERIIVPVPLSNENEKMNSTKENDSSMMAPCSENDGADTSAESSEKNRVEASVNEPRHWDKSWSLDRQGMMKWRKGPGTAVPVQAAEAGPHVRPLAKANSTPVGKSNGLIQDEDSDVDTDCLRRFIKIQVKEVTEAEGTVSGTLLVTPNCLMFDPDVTHPLVRENGQESYMMMAPMEDITSVAVYKDIGVITGEIQKTDKMYDPQHVRTPVESKDITNSFFEENTHLKENLTNAASDISNNECNSRIKLEEPVNFGLGSSFDGASDASNLPLENDDESVVVCPKPIRSESQSSADSHVPLIGLGSASSTANISSINQDDEMFSTDAKVSERIADKETASPGRTRAGSFRSSVKSSAGKVTQTAVSGTKSVAKGVVSQTKTAADTFHTGIQSGAKIAASTARTAVDAVTAVPQGFIGMGNSFFNETENALEASPETVHESSKKMANMKREQSLATLESLRQKTALAREQVIRQREEPHFHSAITSDDRPDLFRPVQELIQNSLVSTSQRSPLTELPYYMNVQIGNRKHAPPRQLNASGEQEDAVRKSRSNEFWFAVPRQRVDAIYRFLLQWSPEKYGQETSGSEHGEGEDLLPVSAYQFADNSFVVLDSEADDRLTGETSGKPFGSSYLNREWEIVAVREICRRLSLDQINQMVLPIPEGAQSEILDEKMIRQILSVLPARAEGYPWVCVYNSEKHGFSLHTLYRRMAQWNEDMSPILLVIRDCKNHVFGTIVSSALLPSEHFYGTGDSCLLFKFVKDPNSDEKILKSYSWTGENQFFVKASKDSISVGAGGGHYGLWLDADLNHGRSLRCETFANEPLSGDEEDFNIQFVEAFGFRMI